MGKIIHDKKGTRLDSQIARFDGRDCFVEILDSMVYLEKPKFIFNFIKYDESKPVGQKYIARIPIYVDYDRADAFASMVLSGTLDRLKFQANKTGAKELFKVLGGTTRQSLEKQNKARKDGLDESRQFIVEAGMRTAFAMKALLGAGETDSKGLIVPKGMPEQQVIIGFSNETIITFARAIQRKVNAMDVLKESNFQREYKKFQENQRF